MDKRKDADIKMGTKVQYKTDEGNILNLIAVKHEQSELFDTWLCINPCGHSKSGECSLHNCFTEDLKLGWTSKIRNENNILGEFVSKMDILKEYVETFGIKEVVNDMGEHRYTRSNSIVFPNGWVASIVENISKPEKGKYSVAMCDYNGYFDWSILDKYGADEGCFYCNTELEIIIACETIRRL